jgi:valyl-tRNA synthetase
MDKAYNPQAVEKEIYSMWESGSPSLGYGGPGGYFEPKIDKNKEPFTVILPPPNANADLHLGHAMYVVEDIMIRYHRMKGDPTLWLPGADHAGFETQYVYEKYLSKQGKSRFDYDRETLYKNIWDFVHTNRGAMEEQLKRLGFSLDWSRNIFTLDPKIITIVYKTFKKLYDDGLIYRGARLVNYCTHCGTSFSDLEVKHVERTDPLYYMKYGPFVLATVRPETKFGDTAVAVNPKDKRFKQWVGKEITVDGLIGPFKVKVIADDIIDPKFGTGIAKVTPAHDFVDFDIGKRHNLPMKQVIGFDGRLTDLCGSYAGLKVKTAREKVSQDMQARNLMDHIDEDYTHTVATCYKCGNVLEPLPLSQWYVSVKPLAIQAIKAIKAKQITFVPKRFEKLALRWLTDFHDWNISRQIVWGMRIPAWQCLDCDTRYAIRDTKNNANVSHVTSHISPNEHWIITDGKKPDKCPTCGGTNLEQDPDTFDTWFSSGQWPFATLQASDKKQETRDKQDNSQVSSPQSQVSDFNYFYPTSVMETGYDILPWWVCRMVMLGLYATRNVPFKTVYLHGLVRDAHGAKMSKSRGNVMNPLRLIDQYGADALRFSLIFGTAAGNDQSLSEDKIRGMRNFANKLWNIGRFIEFARTHNPVTSNEKTRDSYTKEKTVIEKEMKNLVRKVSRNMERYRYSDAALTLYEYTWHKLADVHIEKTKQWIARGHVEALETIETSYKTILILLHPFMPFVTEEIWKMFKKEKPLIITAWPKR